MSIRELTSDDFDGQNLKNVSGKAVILYYATWCHFCVDFKPMYEEMAKFYKDITFLQMDIDKNKDMIQKNNKFLYTYKVNTFPTIVLYKNGKYKSTFKDNRTNANFAKAFDKL